MNRQRKCRTVRLLNLTCCVPFMIGVSSATGEEPKAVGKQADTAKPTTVPAKSHGSDCRRCHFCDDPTPESQCLVHPCTRAEVRRSNDYMADLQGPDVVILDELEDVYLPVPFDHKGHAKMAEMTQGCIICHHYTPEGRQHPACKTCHGIKVEGTDIHKPGLKGAYHRQCLNCHKDWIDETDCAKCHLLKASRPAGAGSTPTTKDDLLGRMHPPITEPTTEIYRAESKQGTKSVVIFRHWEHVNSFDLGCVACHHETNCVRCHAKNIGQEKPRTITEHHRPCIRCHGSDMDEAATTITGRCKRCHWQEGDPKIKPFDHANTGWPLGWHHGDIGCGSCHKAMPYARLDRRCGSCHKDWGPDTFDHAVTGQRLDENHAEIDCEQCHIDRKFDRPPTCKECHDEDEGIGFPAKRPGGMVTAAGAVPDA